MLQELFGSKGVATATVATALTAGIPLAVLLATPAGSYRTFWVLFGTSNQLLAALTLLAVTVWLRRQGKPCWFTALPMVFVFGITLWSLGLQAVGFFSKARLPGDGTWSAPMLANGVVATLLVALAGLLLWEARTALQREVSS
jgi:carbon starvation protein